MISSFVRPAGDPLLHHAHRLRWRFGLVYVYTFSHSETQPGENQNPFAILTVRTYAWILPDWTLHHCTSVVLKQPRFLVFMISGGETTALSSVHAVPDSFFYPFSQMRATFPRRA